MAAKKTKATFAISLQLRPRPDAPAGYEPPSPAQLEEAVKEAVERTHGAYEAVVTATRTDG